MRPRRFPSSGLRDAAIALEDARKRAGVCAHCHQGTAWGSLDVPGRGLLALCAGCAGRLKRTGELP